MALGLMPAMRAGQALTVEEGTSPRLLAQTSQIQALLASWDPRMKHVAIDARAEVSARPPATGTGLFFSGGVDSFYSLVTHRGEITHLVTLNGLDHFTDDRLTGMARAEAAQEGLQLIVVETNARESVKGLDWLQFGHGAVLASAGLLLQEDLGRIFIASTSTPQTLKPVGTHPHLDPLWSTERIEFVHDALIPRRVKLARISDDPVAMRWLRVCWRNPRQYNCGECEKCLRTMIMLDLEGRLGRCATLPTTLDLRTVACARLPRRGVIRWQRILTAAEEAGRVDLARALRRALASNRARNAATDVAHRVARPLSGVRAAARRLTRDRRRP